MRNSRKSITNKTCFSAQVVAVVLRMNWLLLLVVSISSDGCTWEVWRAVKKLSRVELLEAQVGATIRFPRASPANFHNMIYTRKA